MPKKTISVAGKTVTLTQLIVAGVLVIFALAGGFFGKALLIDRLLGRDMREKSKPVKRRNKNPSPNL